MGESPADGDHRRSAARQACRRVGVGGRTCTPERRDLWRDLLPLVIALGPIDEAVRRGIGRASHPRASLGKCPELMETRYDGAATTRCCRIEAGYSGCEYTAIAQFIAVCRRSKWSKDLTNSPLLALRAMAGSKAAHKISSVCSKAF